MPFRRANGLRTAVEHVSHDDQVSQDSAPFSKFGFGVRIHPWQRGSLMTRGCFNGFGEPAHRRRRLLQVSRVELPRSLRSQLSGRPLFGEVPSGLCHSCQSSGTPLRASPTIPFKFEPRRKQLSKFLRPETLFQNRPGVRFDPGAVAQWLRSM